MNLPNKITIFRMLLVFPYLVILTLFYLDRNVWYLISALILFSGAMISDFLDGYIARKHHLISSFGKLFDPIADKIIISSSLIFLSILFPNNVFAFIPIIFIIRDIIVDGLRNVAAWNKTKVEASKWGKLKTILQTFAIIIIFIYAIILSFTNQNQLIDQLNWETQTILIPLYIALFSSVFSGLDYLKKIKKYIKKS